jgi:hypothetical protein
VGKQPIEETAGKVGEKRRNPTDSRENKAPPLYQTIKYKSIAYRFLLLKSRVIRRRDGLPAFHIHCMAEFYELRLFLSFFLFFATSEDD